MSLTTGDLKDIAEIVQGAVSASEERMMGHMNEAIDASERRLRRDLREDLLTVADRLDGRIDETHMLINASRIEVLHQIDTLAVSTQTQIDALRSVMTV